MKMKKRIENIVALVIVLFLIGAAVTFFYPQVRAAMGVTIKDPTREEVSVIRNNLDFDLPDNVEISVAYYQLSPQDDSFEVVFSIPEEKAAGFLNSILNSYETCSISSFGVEDDTITVEGISYEPTASFGSKNREFTNIFQYQTVEGNTWFKLFWNNASDKITDIFYKRIHNFSL